MNKQYQTEDVTGIDIAVPEAVSVSMTEIADDLREGCSRSRLGPVAGDERVDGR